MLNIPLWLLRGEHPVCTRLWRIGALTRARMLFVRVTHVKAHLSGLTLVKMDTCEVGHLVGGHLLGYTPKGSELQISELW